MHTLSDLRVCVDRPLPPEKQTAAVDAAIAENLLNKPRHIFSTFGAPPEKKRIALFTGKMWQTGRTIKCAYIGGDSKVKTRIRDFANEWSKYANIRFAWMTKPVLADIRIAFNEEDGSWSFVGTDILTLDKSEPTMNLGWAVPGIEDEDLRSVVQHEFGHSIGLIHEHQNPIGGFKWNKSRVYADLAKAPNYWNRKTVDENMFMTYSMDQIRGTQLDRFSIMMYAFPKEWTLDGVSTPWNSRISAQDAAFIHLQYPPFRR